MTALRNAATATQTVFDVDTPLGIDAYPSPYTIGSEVVDVVGGGRSTTLTVRRGIGGTTAAAHVNGSTLTAANAFSGGVGGGVTVTDGVTTVDPTSSLTVGVVADGGAGEAVVGTAVISPTDPGAIGAGNLWLDSAAATDSMYPLFVRDPTNAYWLQASIGDKLSTDPLNEQTRYVIVDGDANELAILGIGLSAGHGTATIRVNSVGGDAPYSYITITPTSIVISSGEGGASAKLSFNPGAAFDSDLSIGGALYIGSAGPITQAAFVANGSTVDQLRDALIASGLMAPS